MMHRTKLSSNGTYYYAQYRTMFWPFWRSCVKRYSFPERYYSLREAEAVCKAHKERRQKKNNITYI